MYHTRTIFVGQRVPTESERRLCPFRALRESHGRGALGRETVQKESDGDNTPGSAGVSLPAPPKT